MRGVSRREGETPSGASCRGASCRGGGAARWRLLSRRSEPRRLLSRLRPRRFAARLFAGRGSLRGLAGGRGGRRACRRGVARAPRGEPAASGARPLRAAGCAARIAGRIDCSSRRHAAAPRSGGSASRAASSLRPSHDGATAFRRRSCRRRKARRASGPRRPRARRQSRVAAARRRRAGRTRTLERARPVSESGARSGVPEVTELAARSGDAGTRGSRLLRTRVRRNSPSSETPGVRAAAPVGRSGTARGGLAGAGRLMVRVSRPFAPVARRAAGRTVGAGHAARRARASDGQLSAHGLAREGALRDVTGGRTRAQCGGSEVARGQCRHGPQHRRVRAAQVSRSRPRSGVTGSKRATTSGHAGRAGRT